MHWLRNKKIVVKMGILISLMSVFLAVVGLAGYIYFNQASDFIDHFYNENLISVQIINQARSDSNALKSATLTLTSYTLDHETKKAQLEQIDTRENSIDKFIKDYQALATNAFEQDKLQKIKANFQTIKEINRKAINLSQNGNKIEAQDYYLKNGFSKQDDFQGLLRELGTFNINEAKEQAAFEQNKISVVKRILLVLPVMVIIVSIMVGIVITRMITVPIIKVVAIIKEVSDGNLTVEDLRLQSKDEIGILANGVNIMTGNIRRLISQVATTVEQLSTASVELTASAEQQAQASNQVSVAIGLVASGTEQQSYAIENTSSAIEQMSAAIQEMAASSQEVAEQANNTALASKEGRKVVGEAVNQMEKVGYVTAEVQIAVDKLEQGSKKIGEITNVISGIAAQTNLLALNAAIEAARAGEQGRGFAVVAEEVRKLAEQSQVAAEQITSLVNNNQTNIDNAVKAMQAGTADVKVGIEVVNSAGETFVQIASSINQVVSQIQDVSVSVEEMANSSQLILSSVDQIEGISKDNLAQSQSVSAATEEQTASSMRIEVTSQTLAKMVRDLQVGINKFKL